MDIDIGHTHICVCVLMMTRHKVPQLRTLRLRHFATVFLDAIYSYIHTAWCSSAVPHLAPASHLQDAEDPT